MYVYLLWPGGWAPVVIDLDKRSLHCSLGRAVYFKKLGNVEECVVWTSGGFGEAGGAAARYYYIAR